MNTLAIIYKFFWRIFLSTNSSIKLKIFSIKWSLHNKHNFTTIGNHFPIGSVTVGKMTYGQLNVFTFANGINERLSIGNFVSIASNVNFILGGNHDIETLGTYPYKTYFKKEYYNDSFSKGMIIVEDEVWIGFGVTILSGVKIGKGSIIAAGSVVISNVPPYTLVAGNPAKVKKERFSKEITDELMNINFSNFSHNFFIENINSFYKKLLKIEDVLFLKKIN